MEQRRQHEPGPVRAGAAGHRAHRGPDEGDGDGQHCALPDDGPAYLFWLRDAAGNVAAIVAVVCNRLKVDADVLPFSYVHDHLRPALELLRRDLLARADIDMLNESLNARDKDLELLLSVTGSHPRHRPAPTTCKRLLANAAGHLKCVLAGIVVPDKGLVLTHPESGDVSILTRTQKQLLAITQTRRDPLVINRIATQAGQVAIPYRILACPLRQGSGPHLGRARAVPQARSAGVRRPRRASRRPRSRTSVAASIETSYDTLSGLLTRGALEQRVRLMLTRGRSARQRWSLLYVDIDELHVINENFGMHVGDQAIAQIGDLLRKHLPPNSFAARISGDRFAIVMPSDIDEAAMFGEGLREGVTRLSTAGVDARFRLSISLGVTPLQRPRQRSRTLARRSRIRLQGGQGPRPQSPRELPGKRRQHHPPLHRHQRRHRRALGARGKPPAARSADDRAVRRLGRRASRTTNCCCACSISTATRSARIASCRRRCVTR